MFSAGKKFVALATVPLIAAAIAVPATTYAAENALPVSIAASEAGSTAEIAGQEPAATEISAQLETLVADAGVTWAAESKPAVASAEIDSELECMAKVVHHEAGNQSRRGQLAVAQLIMNRIESGRFASTICGVANQPGQFFRTASYNPRRDTAMWQSAVDVSREARDGTSDEVVPGALFFHAAYASAGNFFRSRQRVSQLGGHIFYR